MDTINILLVWLKNSTVWGGFDAFATLMSILVMIPFVTKYFEIFNWIRKEYYLFAEKHIIVCGLDEENRIYIESELREGQKHIIVIESNKDNKYINYFMKRGVAIVIGNPKDKELLKSLNLDDSEHIFIATRFDLESIEIASQCIETYSQSKIYLHIKDRVLRDLYEENGLIYSQNIKIFSYAEEASRELFEKFDIDGIDHEIIQSSQSFSIAVIGNSELSYEVIRQACIMGQLPHKNELTIYCVDENIEAMKSRLKFLYKEIEKVPHIRFKYIELNVNSKEFYQSDIWQMNLTNIVICLQSEEENLKVASSLINMTYRNAIADDILRTNIILALSSAENIHKKIKTNQQLFKNLYAFAKLRDVFDKKYVVNELRDKRSIALNEIYKKENKDRGKDWMQLGSFAKESNRAAADHIKIKQKYLEIVPFDEAQEVLAECEHNRWNTFHFLNGYVYNAETNHGKKWHNCLIEYNQLSDMFKKYDMNIIKEIRTL